MKVWHTLENCNEWKVWFTCTLISKISQFHYKIIAKNIKILRNSGPWSTDRQPNALIHWFNQIGNNIYSDNEYFIDILSIEALWHYSSLKVLHVFSSLSYCHDPAYVCHTFEKNICLGYIFGAKGDKSMIFHI